MHSQVNEKRCSHVKKFYRKALTMRALLAIVLMLAALPLAAQNRSAELDRAYEEARAAYQALQQASARRDEAMQPQPGERQAAAAGGSRLNENYFARQAILEQELEAARRRYEAAMKRWNDLK